MAASSSAKSLALLALFSWLFALLLGLHSHIQLDDNPNGPATSFFKDVVADKEHHKVSPHVDVEISETTSPVATLWFALIATCIVLLLTCIQSASRYTNRPLAPPRIIYGVCPPTRAPPFSH
jgi:hypothetical protein